MLVETPRHLPLCLPIRIPHKEQTKKNRFSSDLLKWEPGRRPKATQTQNDLRFIKANPPDRLRWWLRPWNGSLNTLDSCCISWGKWTGSLCPWSGQRRRCPTMLDKALTGAHVQRQQLIGQIATKQTDNIVQPELKHTYKLTHIGCGQRWYCWK